MSNAPVVELGLRSPLGQTVAHLADVLAFQGTRTANTIGRARLTLSGDADPRLMRRGMLLDAWWSPYPGYALRPWRVYEIQKTVFKVGEGGLATWEVEGVDLKHILTKRRVRAYKGSAAADKAGPVEVVAKSYVTDHLRGLDTAYGLTVAPTRGLGPLVTKEAARANLYTVLTDLVKAAAETTGGTAVYFNVVEVYTGERLTTRFEVWLDTLGADQGLGSPAPLVLSRDDGTITSLSYSEDAEKEVNRVDVGGGKDEANRVMVTVEDSARARAYPGAAVEGWAEKSDTTDPAVLASVGHKELRAGDIKRAVTVTFADSLALRVGRDFDLGDRCLVAVEPLGMLLPARLSALVLTQERGKTTVSGTLGVSEGTNE